jgi:hypothetical protein
VPRPLAKYLGGHAGTPSLRGRCPGGSRGALKRYALPGARSGAALAPSPPTLRTARRTRWRTRRMDLVARNAGTRPRPPYVAGEFRSRLSGHPAGPSSVVRHGTSPLTSSSPACNTCHAPKAAGGIAHGTPSGASAWPSTYLRHSTFHNLWRRASRGAEFHDRTGRHPFAPAPTAVGPQGSSSYP